MPYSQGAIGFYITNVCNLNCHDCDYLNNYAVKGHQRWKGNEESCRRWAEKMDPAIIFILGGEPMANPDFLQWVHGVARLWPAAEIRINTNGTYFERWPSLYHELLQYHGRVNISISGHNEHNKALELQKAQRYLQGKIVIQTDKNIFRTWLWKKTYNNIKDKSWPDVDTVDDYFQLPEEIQQEIQQVYKINIHDYVQPAEPVAEYEVYLDENNMRISWARWDEFRTSAVKFDSEKNSMTLFDSDPVKAMQVCQTATCGYIKDGKYYKCPFMGIMPDLINQGFPLDISEQDKNLLLSYEPATPDWDHARLENFLKSLERRDPIPQCKFCPENRTCTKIHATTNKIKVIKKPVVNP